MDYDVIVVGAGNAACAAAVSARENGAKRVVLLEKAPRNQRGGNTHFSGAIFRFAFDEVSQLDRFVPDAETEYPGFRAGVPVYPKAAFTEDLMRVTEDKAVGNTVVVIVAYIVLFFVFAAIVSTLTASLFGGFGSITGPAIR